MRKIKNPVVFVVRFDINLANRVTEIAERLDMRFSEIIRRATVAGLGAFKGAQLPPSRIKHIAMQERQTDETS